jgi:hypothetical protein
MKNILTYTLAAVVSTILFACTDNGAVSSDYGDFYYSDEEDCYLDPSLVRSANDKPDSSEVAIRTNGSGNFVRIKIYTGSINSKSIALDTIPQSRRCVVKLQSGRKYVYTAEYQKGDNTIIVPVTAELDYEIKECNGLEYYQVYNNVIDLSLEY